MGEPDSAETTAYDDALKNLANALVWVWTVCEAVGVESGTGISFGGNLPEALSYALGSAAVDLDLDLDDAGNPGDADFAAEGLVRHRPGSWEAVHVRALVFPPDLLRREDAWAYTSAHRDLLSLAHTDSREGRVQQISEDELRALGT